MAGMAAPEKRPEDEASRYVLITQCLQNDFLLNPECRLVLPERSVRTMLLGRRQFELKTGEVVRQLPAEGGRRRAARVVPRADDRPPPPR